MIEKVILGGHDQEEKPDPYMVTFIFKTGLTLKVQGEKVPRKKKGKRAEKECSHQIGQADSYGVQGCTRDCRND